MKSKVLCIASFKADILSMQNKIWSLSHMKLLLNEFKMDEQLEFLKKQPLATVLYPLHAFRVISSHSPKMTNND